MRRKQVYQILGVVAVCAVFAGTTAFTSGSSLKVNVHEIGTGRITQTIEVEGYIESEEEQTYYAKITAPIAEFNVKAGDLVQKGELLVAYDTEDFDRSVEQARMKDIVDGTMDPKKALESVGLSEHMHQFPAQMSGGEQQRTSIARAIAKNPQLLLCDEPTGALDTNTGRDVLELLVGMSRREKETVVMVTHNSSFAEIADKVIRVKNGGIESVIINEHPKDASEVTW